VTVAQRQFNYRTTGSIVQSKFVKSEKRSKINNHDLINDNEKMDIEDNCSPMENCDDKSTFELTENSYFHFHIICRNIQLIKSEWVTVAQCQFNYFSAISWQEQVSFQCDDDEASFILNQHAELDFYSASSLKQVAEILFTHFWLDRIGGVMVIVLTSSAIDCGFEPRSGQTKDCEIGICCFSAKHTALRRKSCLVGFLHSPCSLKQQSADRHVAPLGHIIMIPSQPVFALSP
jgi:hypothetical protein